MHKHCFTRSFVDGNLLKKIVRRSMNVEKRENNMTVQINSTVM